MSTGSEYSTSRPFRRQRLWPVGRGEVCSDRLRLCSIFPGEREVEGEIGVVVDERLTLVYMLLASVAERTLP